ncbi:unnamed protein product [Diatraea saccharalis]|uniref:Lipase n=1 Tax=Diatraea saccharalis TaxID=40085 RepID=A0A9P0CCD9_9NEOP|nr:unnamed protein product [Diatraea saccharalis]
MLLILYVLYFLYNVSADLMEEINSRLPEDGRLNFTELATKYGLETEEYDVITEDNYILKLFHIQGDRTKPILLCHGADNSADTYIMRGNTSLAVTLAKEGYDLWFMNSRDKKYSQRNLYLHPKDADFWNFTFHEIGIYDLSANIDYVLNKTNQGQLTLIGFSQGNQIWFVLGSMRPEYNSKVKVAIALAPVAYLNHARLPDLLTWTLINNFLKASGNHVLFGENSILTAASRTICPIMKAGAEFCINFNIFPICGADPPGLEPEFVPILIGHTPSNLVRKVLDHMVQVKTSKRFQLYDYGTVTNIVKYGSAQPPEYPVKKISAKVELLVGRNDKQAVVDDIQILKQQLPNSSYHEIDVDLWNHIDFVWGKYMKEFLYPLVLDLLKKYN